MKKVCICGGGNLGHVVAGFLAGTEKGGYEYALKLGTAAGGATAFSDGLAVRTKIEELLAQL